jgi:hypothetical protein
MYMLYYASILQCWHHIWILVRTDHPYLGVGCHKGDMGDVPLVLKKYPHPRPNLGG